jgi:hypothetical protein
LVLLARSILPRTNTIQIPNTAATDATADAGTAVRKLSFTSSRKRLEVQDMAAVLEWRKYRWIEAAILLA